MWQERSTDTERWMLRPSLASREAMVRDRSTLGRGDGSRPPPDRDATRNEGGGRPHDVTVLGSFEIGGGRPRRDRERHSDPTHHGRAKPNGETTCRDSLNPFKPAVTLPRALPPSMRQAGVDSPEVAIHQRPSGGSTWGSGGSTATFRPGTTAKAGGAQVTYLGHASLLIETGGQLLATDPVFSERVARIFTRRSTASTFRPEDWPRPSGVLISHGHHDHLDYRSLKRLGANTPVVVPWGLATHLRLHGFTDVRTLRPWETLDLGPWRVVAVPARHFGGRLPLVQTSGYQGYMLCGPATIYFAGDTGFDAGIFRAIAKRFRLDLAILPIAGALVPWFRRNHMNAVEAVAAFQQLGAARMLPIHFETFPASFEAAHRPRQQLLREAERLGLGDRITILAEGGSLSIRDPEPPHSAPSGESAPRVVRNPLLVSETRRVE
jgi:L-ascorbate metabolism protein UlaG (beta-lactamase superfamily)